MLTLGIRFETGKYHATQWGRNVNEGFIDWPPSPWRIMRAIISAWKIYHQDIPEDTMWPILKSMLSCDVSFRLPPATQSHTRHYMPTNVMKKEKLKKEKVIDSFVIVDKESSLFASWADVSLDKNQESTLRRVLKKIRYLGRAESWCNVLLTDEKIEPNCVPLDGEADNDMEITDVLVPSADATLGDLLIRTARLHNELKMIYPPKSRRMQYVRPADSLSHVPSTDSLGHRSHHLPNVTVVRYIITGSVRPKITETVLIGDAIKRTAMSKYGSMNSGVMSQVLSGRTAKGKTLQDNHAHAFFLPTDEDDDGILDHVTVVAKNPFSELELKALGAVRYIWHRDRIKLVFASRGNSENLTVPILRCAAKWKSTTPYVLNMHPKTKGFGKDKRVVNGPEFQLLREIRNRGMPDAKIDVQDRESRICSFLPVEFKRWRRDRLLGFGAYDIRLEFEKEMSGPLSFGHASHFGLGMFVPDSEASDEAAGGNTR